MPKLLKMTIDRLPQHLDDSAHDHGGHGWKEFDQIMKTGDTLKIKIRPVDVAYIFGVDSRTASGWIKVYREAMA